MGYVNTDPKPSMPHILGYDPVEAEMRLKKRTICGLVVIINRKSWQYCKLKAGHKEPCRS